MGSWRAPLRSVKHWLDAVRWSARIDFFIAVGSTGRDYYAKHGYRPDRLYPFGYAVAPRESRPASSIVNRRVLFVGQLIHRKGIDLLLRAFAAAMGASETWYLDIVGDGPLRTPLATLAERLGLEGRVTWHGNQNNERVRELMASAPMLVLPSRYDGWGAVVNEALMAGTPVVVSDACGAADLVADSDRGVLFRAGSTSALAEALSVLRERIERDGVSREDISAWAQETISPEAFASYFVAIIAHTRGEGERPDAPWLATNKAAPAATQPS
jgi:glycosyltransferase involved in cell wall biosynthesis